MPHSGCKSSSTYSKVKRKKKQRKTATDFMEKPVKKAIKGQAGMKAAASIYKKADSKKEKEAASKLYGRMKKKKRYALDKMHSGIEKKRDFKEKKKRKCDCWKGYERVPGTEPCAPNSCRKKSSQNFKEESSGITKSNKPRKKWMKKVGGKTYHAGDSNYTISPGSKRGDSYCARSYGIKKKHGSTPRNEMARKKWRCRGRKSMRSK